MSKQANIVLILDEEDTWVVTLRDANKNLLGRCYITKKEVISCRGKTNSKNGTRLSLPMRAAALAPSRALYRTTPPSIHAGGTVTGGAVAGTLTVLESSGGPFVEGEHSLVRCVVYARSSAVGMGLEAPCTLTDASTSGLVTRRIF